MKKAKIIEAIQTILVGVILAAIMFLGAIETVRAAIYLAVVLVAGFGALLLVNWYDDYFVGENE